MCFNFKVIIYINKIVLCFLTVQLMKGARDLTKHSRVLLEKHDDYFRFSIATCSPDDTGTYCVMVRNKFGNDRAFVTLKVRCFILI